MEPKDDTFLRTQSYMGPIHFQIKTGMDVHFVNPLEEPGPIQVRVIRQVDSLHGYRTDGRTGGIGAMDQARSP